MAFASPHIWWGLGISFGFPGGQASYDFFMASAWRVVYDWTVVVMSALMVAIVVTLLKPPSQRARHRIPYGFAWFAAVILTLRGVAGIIVDGTSDLIWNPFFLIGGILMIGVVGMARMPKPVV